MGKIRDFFNNYRQKIQERISGYSHNEGINLAEAYSPKTIDDIHNILQTDEEIAAFNRNMEKVKNEKYIREATAEMKEWSPKIMAIFSEIYHDPDRIGEPGIKEFKEAFEKTKNILSDLDRAGDAISQTISKANYFYEAEKQTEGNPLAEGLNIADRIISGAEKSNEIFEQRKEQEVFDFGVSMGLTTNGLAPDGKILTAYSTVNGLAEKIDEMKEKITPAMQMLYNVRRNFEEYAKMRIEGKDIEIIKETLKNTMTMPGEDMEAFDVRLSQYEREFRDVTAGAKYSVFSLPKPSLQFLADQMKSFNMVVEDTNTYKLIDEIGINSNKINISINAFNDKDNKTTDFASIVKLLGADKTKKVIDMITDTHKGILQGMEQSMGVTWVDSVGIMTDRETGEGSLVLSALDTGLEFLFDIESKETELILQHIRFCEMDIDRNFVLKNDKLQHIIAGLPDNMRKQVETNLGITMGPNGVYGQAIIANGASRAAMENEARMAIEKALESSYKETVVFGSSGKPKDEPDMDQSLDEHPMTGWDKD